MRSSEARAIIRFLQEAYSVGDADMLAHYLVSALQLIMSADSISYNHIEPSTRRIAWVRKPGTTLPDAEQIFGRSMLDHPAIAHRYRTHTGEALRISDFLTTRAFHRTTLYNEYYRRVDVEHQLAVALPTSKPTYIAIALNRRSADFTAHELFLLNLLRPHLIQIHANANAVTRLLSQFILLSQGVDQAGFGLVVLQDDERIETATTAARRWLAQYFEKPEQSTRLPQALEQWLRQHRIISADDIPGPAEPFIVERQGKRLLIRLCWSRFKRILWLSEKRTAIEPKSLEPLGLSHREAEVLRWVTEGKSNAAIGVILGVSVRTVQHHLDRIYRKLGVESRTAAATRAFRALQDSGEAV